MKAVFFTRTERGRVEESDWRETNLAEALQKGARVHGDEVEIRIAKGAWPDDVELVEADLVCLCGVKSRFWFRAYADAGIPWLYFDKGYIRERAPTQWLSYWRLSVNQHHPVAFLDKARKSGERAAAAGTAFRYEPWRRERGAHIIVDGGSEKNFKFNRIVPETSTIKDIDEHCRHIVRRIEEITDRPVVYRPKPSSKGREPIEGTEFARGRAGVHVKDASYDIKRAHVIVSYSSAIGYEAHRMGIPSIVLGNGPARPISSTKLEDIEYPRLASEAVRAQWASNLAWCQFGIKEYADGTAWRVVREMVECTPL